MIRIGTQRGEGRAGCVFWILMTLLFGLVAAEVVPIKIATMKLEDHMKDLAMTRPRGSRDLFEKEIFKKAKFLNLDIPRKQIRVKKYKERVIMDVEFTAPLDVVGFNFDWDVSIHVDRDLFLM